MVSCDCFNHSSTPTSASTFTVCCWITVCVLSDLTPSPVLSRTKFHDCNIMLFVSDRRPFRWRQSLRDGMSFVIFQVPDQDFLSHRFSGSHSSSSSSCKTHSSEKFIHIQEFTQSGGRTLFFLEGGTSGIRGVKVALPRGISLETNPGTGPR